MHATITFEVRALFDATRCYRSWQAQVVGLCRGVPVSVHLGRWHRTEEGALAEGRAYLGLKREAREAA